MEEIKGNSHASKNQSPDPDIQQIITGDVEIKKPSNWKRFRRSFIAGDANTVGEHVFWNVILPSARNGVWNAVETFLHMMFYNNTNTMHNPYVNQVPKTGIGSNSKFNYSTGSQGAPLMMNGAQQMAQQALPEVDRNVPNQFVVPTRADADLLIQKMRESINSYTVVTVANVYRFFGKTPTWVHTKWGWRHLEDHEIVIKRTPSGSVLVILSDPESLDN